MQKSFTIRQLHTLVCSRGPPSLLHCIRRRFHWALRHPPRLRWQCANKSIQQYILFAAVAFFFVWCLTITDDGLVSVCALLLLVIRMDFAIAPRSSFYYTTPNIIYICCRRRIIKRHTSWLSRAMRCLVLYAVAVCTNDERILYVYSSIYIYI